MKRGHVEHLLCGYIDGTLSPHASRKVEAHLSACGNCARELARWRAVLHLVSHHARMACPTDCAETVLRILEARRGERLIDGVSDTRAGSGQPLLQWMERHSRLLSCSPFSRVAAAVAVLALIGGASHRWMPGPHRSTHLARWAATGRTARSTGAASSARRDRWAISASLDSTRRPVRAHGPDRLQEAFGRSDRLILAADFVEDDR